MLGLKLYPNFKLQIRATKIDQNIIALLSAIKKGTQAQYVNYSIIDYSGSSAVTQHYITFPLHWISIYLKQHFQDIDPLQNVDYRICSMIDWQEFWHSENDIIYYHALCEAGIGDHGITLNTYIGANRYGSMSLVFDHQGKNWQGYRDQHLDHFRELADKLCIDMENVIGENLIGNDNNLAVQLTRREHECLYWAAIGKTDIQIADVLGIGRWTVNTHMNKSKSKLDCPNRTSAVAKAISLELVNIDQPAQV